MSKKIRIEERVKLTKIKRNVIISLKFKKEVKILKILMKAEKDKLAKEKEIIQAKMNQFPQKPFKDTFENEEELKNYINLIKENKKYFIEKLNDESYNNLNEDSLLVTIAAIALLVFIGSLILNIFFSIFQFYTFWPITSVSLAVLIFYFCCEEIKNTIKTEFYLKKLEAKLKEMSHNKGLDKTLEKEVTVDNKPIINQTKDAYFKQVEDLIIEIKNMKGSVKSFMEN